MCVRFFGVCAHVRARVCMCVCAFNCLSVRVSLCARACACVATSSPSLHVKDPFIFRVYIQGKSCSAPAQLVHLALIA